MTFILVVITSTISRARFALSRIIIFHLEDSVKKFDSLLFFQVCFRYSGFCLLLGVNCLFFCISGKPGTIYSNDIHRFVHYIFYSNVSFVDEPAKWVIICSKWKNPLKYYPYRLYCLLWTGIFPIGSHIFIKWGVPLNPTLVFKKVLWLAEEILRAILKNANNFWWKKILVYFYLFRNHVS